MFNINIMKTFALKVSEKKNKKKQEIAFRTIAMNTLVNLTPKVCRVVHFYALFEVLLFYNNSNAVVIYLSFTVRIPPLDWH